MVPRCRCTTFTDLLTVSQWIAAPNIDIAHLSHCKYCMQKDVGDTRVTSNGKGCESDGDIEQTRGIEVCEEPSCIQEARSQSRCGKAAFDEALCDVKWNRSRKFQTLGKGICRAGSLRVPVQTTKTSICVRALLASLAAISDVHMKMLSSLFETRSWCVI